VKFTCDFSLAKIALGAASSVVAISVLLPSSAHALTIVDTELFLSIDSSGSISASQFDLQKTGYVNAFKDVAIQNQIASLPNGLAVALGYWASDNQQNVAVNWSLLKTAADANNFADLIAATTRPFSGSTAPGNAIQFAANQLLTNAFEGKKIIDVSGDGNQNDGINTKGARDAAFNQGITINGLPIGNNALQTFYQNNIVTSNGFLIAANDFDDFDTAIRQKIGREVTNPDPIPTPALLPGLIGLGLGVLRKRQAAATEPARNA
jgi:Protein of unknown function (DUF1194)